VYNTPKKVASKNKISIWFFVVVLILAIVLFYSGYVLYTSLTADKGGVEVFFNVDSDLPDPSAELKFPTNRTYGGGLSRIEVGEAYNVKFSIRNNLSYGSRYFYHVRSHILNDSGFIDVNPSETLSVILPIEIRETDKWVLRHREAVDKISVFDLSHPTWLGLKSNRRTLVFTEGNSSAVIAVDKNINLGDVKDSSYTYIPVDESSSGKTLTKQDYLYDPISVSLDGFGDVLNLNLSLDDLRDKPFLKSFSTVTVKEERKIVDVTSVRLSVIGEELILNKSVERFVYESNPDYLLITVSRDKPHLLPMSAEVETKFAKEFNDRSHVSIGFWYVIM